MNIVEAFHAIRELLDDVEPERHDPLYDRAVEAHAWLTPPLALDDAREVTKPCARCGSAFTLAPIQLAWYAAHGYAEPTKCDSCRRAIRASRGRRSRG